ncbi:MAG: hypothetical protein ABMA01_12540, partial [Chthoniobacteraceae bacterium]
MSIQVDPLIQEKLGAFAARRRRLIIIRGVLAAVAMLLGTMLIVAAIDFQWMLPDWARWSLSGAAYLAVLVIAWRQCLGQLVRSPDERQLARLIEHAEPRLREDLISAVELGSVRGQVFDSEQFRALLQKDVAHRMEGMEVTSLLPVALIRRSIGYALAIGVAVIALMAATGWQFHTLLLRALLPGANLERVSRTKVIIVEPEKGDRIVPQGDTVRVVVELGGENANRARIETFGESEGRQMMDMQPIEGNRFAATVQVGRESVRYRIRAGDALTRKYHLDARERPFVTEFEKTFHPPAYAELPVSTVVEPEGGLSAIEGTEVELKLRPNQPVNAAELRVEMGKTASTIPLTKDADGRLGARITLAASGSYRVHLVGAETGFENKFSPENELRAEPDLVPTVELERPTNDLILPANEVVDIAGNAADDLGLAKVSQLVKVNDGGWKETVLLKKPGKKARIETRWDLFSIGVKPGDLLTTKLVVTDLKGSKGESRPLQVTVTAAGFEMRRLQTLAGLRALNETMQVLAGHAQQLSKTVRKVGETFQRRDADETAQRQALLETTGALTEFDAKFIEAWTTLGTALREAKAGHAAAELVMLGRSLARLNAGSAKLARANAAVIEGRSAIPAARGLFAEITGETAKVEQRAVQAAAAIEAVTTSEESGVLVENSQVLVREQQRLMELAESSGVDPAKWAPVMSRLRVSVSQAKAIEEILEPIAKRDRSPARDRAKSLLRELTKRREEMSGALGAEGVADKRMLKTLSEYTRVLRDHSRNLSGWHREFGFRPVSLMQSLAQDTGPVYANVAKLREELERLGKAGELPPEVKLALADSRWSLRGELFKTAGDLEEIRAQADNQFVGDLRNATAAIEALRAVAAGTAPERVREKLEELDAVFRVLESGHNLQECLDGFNHLATGERWEIRSLSASTDAPRDWKWLEGRLRVLPDELGRARPEKAEEEVRAAFAQAQQILVASRGLPAWRGIDSEMGARANIDRMPISSREDAAQLAGQVKLALDLLRKPMDDARARLARISPSVAELASALAKEQEALKKETEGQAATPAAEKTDDAKSEPARQLAQQQQINRKVETLKDLIRADANKQNILDQEQRESMRDADDALAMLKDPPPKAEEALKDAAAAPPAQQKADLGRAAEQQQKLADALGQIAKHFDAKQKGESVAETRAAMREAEKELGIKEELDQQQSDAKMLAELAQKSAEELLKELEAKLPENPVMQKELSAISKDALAAAEQKLAEASKTESRVARELGEQAKQNPQDTAKQASAAAKEAMAAAQAAQKAAESAKEQAKAAANQPAEQQADNAAKQAAAAAQAAEQAAQSATQMEKSADPQQTAQAAQQTALKAGEAAQAAEQSAKDAQQAQASAQQAAQKGGEQQAQNQQAGQQSAEAQKQAAAAAKAAKAAQAAAQQAAAMAQQGPQLAKAAQEQQPVAANSQQAAADTDRAGRHEARLGNQPAGEQLQKLAAAVQQTAKETVPAAEQALGKAQMAAEAQGA